MGNIPHTIQDIFKKYSHDKIKGNLNYTSGYAYIVLGNNCYVWNYQKVILKNIYIELNT